ncbi:DUF3037 domain-containing protein [Candidatus Poribacteria bacterium]|nr:DUF3037 domain-containing protein [Candidatus Poribacteria bacterium]
MAAARGYYALIQYCPDSSRMEASNVGVLLFRPDPWYLGVRTAEGNDRPRRFFGTKSFDAARLNAAKKALEIRLRHRGTDFRTLDDLNAFIDTRANDLIVTAPRPMSVRSPGDDLERLFQELVGGRRKPQAEQEKASEPLVPELDECFRELAQDRQIQFNQRVIVPVTGRELCIPYSYVNGRENLIATTQFPAKEQSSLNVATQWALHGDLLQRHRKDGNGSPCKFIMVALFPEDHPRDVRMRELLLFGEYQLQVVEKPGVDGFIRAIREQAH